MDRASEKEKSSRDYRDKHRSSKDKHYEDDHRHQHHRSKHRSEDGHHRSEREGSRDRAHYHDRKEESEKKNLHKRKDRAESVDRNNGDEKRARVSDNKKEKRRLEDENGREKQRIDDGDWRDKEDERRERRRFEDKAKEEDVEVDEERRGSGFEMKTFKKEPKEEPTDSGHDDAVGSIAKVCFINLSYFAYFLLPYMFLTTVVFTSSILHEDEIEDYLEHLTPYIYGFLRRVRLHFVLFNVQPRFKFFPQLSSSVRPAYGIGAQIAGGGTTVGNGAIPGARWWCHSRLYSRSCASCCTRVVTMGSYNASRTLPDNCLAHGDSPATKVSLLSTNENKGVNINGSHQVPGKSSTDGTASGAGKGGSLSLDALAKAKRALQMRKELAEKLKKIPALNKNKGSNFTREGLPPVGPKESLQPSANAGIFPTSAASLDAGVLQTPGSAPSTSILAAAASTNPPPSGLPHLVGLTAQKYEAVKRAQELAAKMGFRQDPEFAPLINMFPGQMPPEVTLQPKPAKAPVLRLDALGREIDEQGNIVNMPKPSSTLKVNINKKKQEAFQILKPEFEVDPEKNPHFDLSMGIDKNKILRPKRMTFQFVEEGKWSRDAEIIKLKSQFGEARAKELKAKQAQLTKAKAEPDINPNLIEVSERVITKEKQKEPIPEVEWWDAPLLRSGTYGDVVDGNVTNEQLKIEKITIYVEHPRPIEPPAEPAPPPPQPLKLTKKEQKKLRTQRRLAREKERQEMIRQGLVEPPKPKVKMSNLMKVLGSEATQDPTKLEMEIRSAAAEREQAHVDRNVARKLTPDERREKKERKLFDDPNIALETMVSVYKINDLSHPQTRFKVDVNAQENRLTGCAVISEGISVVVVEGGKKSIKRYGKLMLRRIDWAAAGKKEDDEGEDGGEDEDKPLNKCVLVWQGSVAKSSFNRFFVYDCRTEAAARKVFADAGVPHYWDLAVNFKDDDF
ncbi:Protein rdm16 [Datura stramonium]|uniref:Protein rdm16 n=1 Tax=Datura stramonium TaxID=4076 RepID=A0ABS8S4I6_DATST|nr:Protein rdm16 [Datura stramonium]